MVEYKRIQKKKNRQQPTTTTKSVKRLNQLLNGNCECLFFDERAEKKSINFFLL